MLRINTSRKKITSTTDILLKELSTTPASAQGIKFNIENSKIFKNQTIGYDLNTLRALAKDDPQLASLLEKLEGMLGKNEPKPTINPALEQKVSLKNEQVAQIKDEAKVENPKLLPANESLKSEVATKQKIDQSGIFFENRLKDSLLPANEKSAFVHVVKNVV